MSALLQSLTGLTWLDPWMLWLMLLVPLGLCVRRWRGAPAVSFSPGRLLERGPLPGAEYPSESALASGGPTAKHRMPRSFRMWLLPLPPLIQILGLLLVVLALARPMQRVQMPLETEGIDILLCLDISSSMSANDLDPQLTRLDLAKAAAVEFINGRPDDRIGLIRFARYPDLLCPPTLDHRALQDFVNDLEMVESDGFEDLTGIGTAVARSAQVLQGSLGESKVVILLTDGEENVATVQTPDEIGPLQAARLCEQLGVRAYTIAAGIGRRTQEGEWVPVDTSQVRSLAEMTGGEFYEARDAGAIADVYATINELEKAEFQEPRYELQDAFLPFLLAGVGLLLLSRLLRSTVLEVLP